MKRYSAYNDYLRARFGQRVQKIALDAGLNCPNRDGTISDQGCIYCDGRGSGSGAMIRDHRSIDEQILSARVFMQKRYGARLFLAYFQSFTNTYAPVSYLKELYDRALRHDDMVGLAIGTRPDCVNQEILALLQDYQKKYLVWIEFGLQSAHDATLERINRGHDVACFEESVLKAHQAGLNICVHIILGLPGETRAMMLDTARFLARLPIQGIKMHLLYVIKDTSLASWYAEGRFQCLAPQEYYEIVAEILERLPPGMIIQRLTADPRKEELIAPLWALEKQKNLAGIHAALERKNTRQGRLYGSAAEK